MRNQNLVTRATYWSEVDKFEQSVISGLIWYIQVSLLHNGHLPDNTTSERMKVPQSLLPYLYSEANRVFNMFYQEKNLHEFVVLDCEMYPHLNGYRGRISSFNHQNGQYIVTLNSSQFSLPSTPSSLVMQLYPQYMEPLAKMKKFGITIGGTLQTDEIVSLPNTLCASDTTRPHLKIKFYSKLFELMRKRYIRPESTPNFRSINALLAELTKMDDESSIKDEQNRDIRLEYTALQYNLNSFKMPFRVFDRSLFQSGRDLNFFELDMNVETMDDLLETVFAEEGTIDFNKTSFDTLIPGHLLDSKIIDLCLKW